MLVKQCSFNVALEFLERASLKRIHAGYARPVLERKHHLLTCIASFDTWPRVCDECQNFTAELAGIGKTFKIIRILVLCEVCLDCSLKDVFLLLIQGENTS